MQNYFMKNLFLLLALCCIVFTNYSAHAQSWVWAKSAPGYSSTHPSATCTDPSGNVIIAGETYLAKYNSTGGSVWFKDPTNGFSGNAISVCTDASGNIFVAGFYTSSITFGSITLTNSGSDDIFLAKYDPSGSMIWVKSAGGSSYDDAYSVTTDLWGNVYLAGGFGSASITFGSTILTGMSQTMFLVKYNTSGSVVWAKSAGSSSGSCRACSAHTDNSGNILVTGNFSSSTLAFGTTTLTNIANPYPDMFVAKYDSAGNALWAKSAGGDSYDGSWKISTDGSGNSYVVGGFTSGSMSFGSTMLTNVSTGSDDLFLASYDPSGNLRWAKQTGGNGDDEALSVVSDNAGNTYIAGSFSSSSLPFGTTTLTKTTGSSSNFFVAKYNNSGSVQWAIKAGGTDNDGANDLTLDASGYVYVAGTFASPTLNLGSNTLTNSGGFDKDIFIAKLNGGASGIPEQTTLTSNAVLFPNPAATDVVVSLDVIISNVRIVDLAGKVLFDHDYNSHRVLVNTSFLPAGIYQIVVNNKEVRKLIKE